MVKPKVFLFLSILLLFDRYRQVCNIDCNKFSGWSWPSCLVRGIQTFDLRLHPCRLIKLKCSLFSKKFRLLQAECENEPIYPGKCKREGYGLDIVISVESEFGICRSVTGLGKCSQIVFDTFSFLIKFKMIF